MSRKSQIKRPGGSSSNTVLGRSAVGPVPRRQPVTAHHSAARLKAQSSFFHLRWETSAEVSGRAHREELQRPVQPGYTNYIAPGETG